MQDTPVLYIVVHYCHVCLFVVMCDAVHCARQWKVEWSDCHVWSGKLVVGRATSLLPICNESNFINVIAIIINIITIIVITIIIIININATAAPPVSNKSKVFSNYKAPTDQKWFVQTCFANYKTTAITRARIGFKILWIALWSYEFFSDPRAFVIWDLKSRR